MSTRSTTAYYIMPISSSAPHSDQHPSFAPDCRLIHDTSCTTFYSFYPFRLAIHRRFQTRTHSLYTGCILSIKRLCSRPMIFFYLSIAADTIRIYASSTILRLHATVPDGAALFDAAFHYGSGFVVWPPTARSLPVISIYLRITSWIFSLSYFSPSSHNIP